MGTYTQIVTRRKCAWRHFEFGGILWQLMSLTQNVPGDILQLYNIVRRDRQKDGQILLSFFLDGVGVGSNNCETVKLFKKTVKLWWW